MSESFLSHIVIGVVAYCLQAIAAAHEPLLIKPLAEKKVTELPAGQLTWTIETFDSVTLADAAVNKINVVNSEQIFTLADTIATVNSLQSEALGEVIAAAQQVIAEMRNLGIPLALDLERITTPDSVTLTSRHQITAEIIRRLFRQPEQLGRRDGES